MREYESCVYQESVFQETEKHIHECIMHFYRREKSTSFVNNKHLLPAESIFTECN